MKDRYDAITDSWLHFNTNKRKDISDIIGKVRDVSVDRDGVSITCEIANQSPSLNCMKIGDDFASELRKHFRDMDEMTLFGTHPFPYSYPEIKRVIFSGPATIVLFTDGTKSIVKCSENDIYDPEKAVMVAYLKKLFGFSKSKMRKWLNKQTEEFKEPNDILEESK